MFEPSMHVPVLTEKNFLHPATPVGHRRVGRLLLHVDVAAVWATEFSGPSLLAEPWEDSQELIVALVSMAEVSGGVIRTRAARKKLMENELLPSSKRDEDAPAVRRAASVKLHRVLSRSDALVWVRHGGYKLRHRYHAKKDLTSQQDYLFKQLRGESSPHTTTRLTIRRRSASRPHGFRRFQQVAMLD